MSKHGNYVGQNGRLCKTSNIPTPCFKEHKDHAAPSDEDEKQEISKIKKNKEVE